MTTLIGSSLYCVAERFNLHIHTRRQIELHQSVHGVRCRLQNVDQTLVGAHLKLLAGLFVHMRRAQHRPAVDGSGQRNRPGNFRAGTLRCFHNLPRGLVQDAVIKCLQTNSNFVALSHIFSSEEAWPSAPNYSMISVTAPAPTVWPPSLMANRKPFSSATGVINVTSQLTLSPGITISTAAGKCISPVTSVVRK